MRAGSILKLGFGLALAGVLLFVVARQIDRAVLVRQLREASIGGLVLAAALNVGHNVFRVWRWGVLLAPVRPALPFRPMFDAVIVGYTTTWTMPGRLGELVRPMLLSARERVPLAPCLGSVLADRLLDGLAVAVLFVAALAVTPLEGQAAAHASEIRSAAAGAAALIVVALVALLVAGSVRGRLEQWLAARRGLVGWAWRSTVAFARGAEAFRQPRLLWRLAVLTLAAWLTIGAGTWVGIRAAGAAVPPGAAFVIMPLLVLGIALPTPGGAGGYHVAMTFGLSSLFGVSQPVAAGTSVLVHAIVVVPIVLLGAVLLLAQRGLAHDVREALRQVRAMRRPGAGLEERP
jgi:uncharacterized protein (TIRG00374 family)